MRVFEIRKIRNIAYYPYKLLEAEVVFEDDEKVYACISVDEEQIWAYKYDIERCMQVTDDPYELRVFPAEIDKIQKCLYKIWNENPTWNREWRKI